MRLSACRAVLLVVLALAGCATGGETVEQTLADAGVRTTDSLARDVNGFARRLEEGDAAAAFVATWKECSRSAATCSVTVPPQNVQAQRVELATAVALRAQAIGSLNRAYASFRLNVSQRTNESAERDVRSAVTGTFSYASSLTQLPLSVVSEAAKPLERAVGYVSAAAVAQRRRKEMLSTSEQLRNAIVQLREALLLETRKYDALTEALVRERIEAQRALLQAGLVSGSDALRPVAEGLKVPLARDADVTMARSAPARMAVEAVIEASERAEVRRTQARYRAAIDALAELEHLHDLLNTNTKIDLTRLDEILWNLDRLADLPTTRTTAPAAVSSTASVASGRP